MRKRLIILVSILLILPTPSAFSAPVTASAGETICNQTVGNAAGVTAYRLSSMYCVVEFRTVGSTTWTVPAGVTSIEYLVVAGGGGGAGGIASEHGGGGGGAGGVLAGTLNVSQGTVNLTVGDGGASVAKGVSGSNGSDSSLAGSVTAVGGGGGGGYYTAGPSIGGSGGGSGSSNDEAKRNGANGTAGQGNRGGGVTSGSFNGLHGGGGGGAGGDGGNTVTSGSYTVTAGAGGIGTTSSITGSTTYYGGGGGGGGSSRGAGASGGGSGGSGGGGNGATWSSSSIDIPTSGASNTGGGGGGGVGTGGGNATVGAAGGSGIVIIRYLLAPAISVTPAVSGSTTYGETLTATTGTWLYSPTSYAYQWSRAATVGGTYTNISGATSVNYRLVTADVNQFLKVTVTATNSGGSGTSTSTATAAISRATPGTSLTVATGDFIYRTTKELSVTSSVAGKVTFRANRETIAGCRNLTLNAGNSFARICSYKPSIHGLVVITVAFTPTDTSFENRSVVSAPYPVKRRISARN